MIQIPFSSEALIRALGWTLFHSIWQGALIALIGFIVLQRLSTAQQRYKLAYSSLCLIFISVIGTFIWLIQREIVTPATESIVTVSPEILEAKDLTLSANFTTASVSTTILAEWFETYTPHLVTLWCIGLVFFLGRIILGLRYVWLLRKHQTLPVEAFWMEKLQYLAGALGHQRPINLLESALVHTPVAIGWLRPLILLPVGWINQLSVAEVEAILAHEIAHLKRQDWLFNLIQVFIEALLYYHPAVWWFSAVIRRERENCCDDAALTVTGNRLAYAKALVHVQELAKPIPVPALALAIEGKNTFMARRKTLLLERIKRVLHQPSTSSSHIMEKIIASVILLVLLALVSFKANSTSVSTAFAQITDIPTYLWNTDDEIPLDSVPKPSKTKQKIVSEDDNKRVEAEYQDGQLTRLNIDGKEIPPAEFGTHLEVTDALLTDIEIPEVLEVPEVASFWGMAEVPSPPYPPTPARIMNQKSDKTTTILQIDANGKPMEIVVKDGAVWVDGKKMEQGESLDLYDFGITEPNTYIYTDGDEVGATARSPRAPRVPRSPREPRTYSRSSSERSGYSYSDDDHARVRNEELENLARLQEDLAQNMKTMTKKERKQLEKDMERLNKDMGKLQRELNGSQRAALRDAKATHEQAMAAHDRAMEEHDRSMVEHHKNMKLHDEAMVEHNKAMEQHHKDMAFWDEQLRRDGLIGKNAKTVKFILNDKELIVNDQKQSAELHRKYLEFYTSRGGKPFTKGTSFMINRND